MSNRLPTVTSPIPRDLRAFLDRVRETFSATGRDRLLTVNDLVQGGIADSDPSGNIRPPGDGAYGTPPPAGGVSATGSIQNIIVEWDLPQYFGHDYTEVWRSDTNNLGDAVLLGLTPGAIYVDPVGAGVTRYYWVRFVNLAGTKGPFNATSGTMGQTGPAVDYLLDVLTGQITESQLFEDLGARIDLIDVGPNALVPQVTSLNGKYTVKIDNNGYVSGFGLASTANDATPFSEFAIRADRFYVASPSGPGITPIIPFVVNTTTQTINGVSVPPGVYMDAAFIKNGTITNAKIGNAAIDDAKIANLSAGKITAGSISTGDYIQSTSYIAGTQGWRIHGNGFAEFGAASIRGQLTASQIDSRGLSIKDASGNIILSAGTPLTTSYISGLGTLATQNTVSTGQVTGLGTLATQNTVSTGQVTGLGSLATQNNVFLDGDQVQFWNGSSYVPLRTDGFVNSLTKISSGNISTFMVSAAIGEAYIGNLAVSSAKIQDLAVGSAKIQDAAITNAKIGSAAVDTLKIGGNAVTVPATVSGYLSTAISKNGFAVWQSVMTLSVDFGSIAPSATAVFASINVLYQSGSGQTASYIRIREAVSGAVTDDNGVTHTNSVQITVTDAFTTAFTGSRTFHIEVSQLTGGPSFTIGNANLTVLGAKR